MTYYHGKGMQSRIAELKQVRQYQAEKQNQPKGYSRVNMLKMARLVGPKKKEVIKKIKPTKKLKLAEV